MTTIPFDEAELAVAEPVILRQTPLSRYVKCPMQGLAVELGLVDDASAAADAGSENHRIIAEAIAEHIAGEDFRDYVQQEKVKARPDVQDEVVSALSRSGWAVNAYLRYKVRPGMEYPQGVRRSPEDVLLYQSGEGRHNPQLAWDLLPATSVRGPIRITSEIDLLVAGASEDELEETDFKRWQTYGAADILKAFQFRCHAWLIFRNYPDCQRLRMRTWSLPRNETSPWVTFHRDGLEAFEGLLLTAVQVRERAMEIAEKAQAVLNGDHLRLPKPEAALAVEIDEIARKEGFLPDWPLCWPDGDKCVICAAVRICPRALRPSVDLNIDPARFAADTQTMQIALDQRIADLGRYVDQHGDIEANGLGCGRGGPRATRKPTVRFWTTETAADGKETP